jgi:hypothetical protein
MTHPVGLRLTAREAVLVQEALSNWSEARIDEASPWDVLALVEAGPMQGPPEMTKAIKGLQPPEVKLIRHFKDNAKSKTGDTGEVVALSPNDWLRIKQEIEANPEQYEQMMGHPVSAVGLAKKIGDQLRLAMGGAAKPHGGALPSVAPKVAPVSQPKAPAFNAPAQGGAVMGGQPAGPFGNRSSDDEQAKARQAFISAKNRAMNPAPAAAEDPEARRRRVAAQDMEMMGGKDKINQMMRNPRFRAENIEEDTMEGDVLTKRTTHANSISLKQDEYDAVMNGQVKQVVVMGQGEKKVGTIDGARMAAWIAKGGAEVRDVNDDPDMPHYWVVKNIGRLLRR